MPNPNIAIIGLEGSGKTVLMTVLAKTHSAPVSNGFYLEPISAQTMKRVDGTWLTLRRGEWPPSTPPGEMAELKWKLHFARSGMNYDADIRMIDLSGQDMRQLFSNYSINQVRKTSAAPHLKPIARYLSEATMLLFILNIRDYVTETNDERLIENQAALKAALDQLSGSKQILLVFTQYDQYEEYINRTGGLDAFCEKYIPYIYYAYLDPKGKARGASQLSSICVSAVYDTQSKIDKSGTARQVPAPNFTSRGLDELQKWLEDQLYPICQQEHAEKERQRQEEERRQQEQERRRREYEQEQERRRQEQERIRQEQKNKEDWDNTVEEFKLFGKGLLAVIIALIVGTIGYFFFGIIGFVIGGIIGLFNGNMQAGAETFAGIGAVIGIICGITAGILFWNSPK